jgi:hypothetical protein
MKTIFSNWIAPAQSISIKDLGDVNDTSISNWLESSVSSFASEGWLVCEMDDGITWGRLEKNTLFTSDKSKEIRVDTLRSLKLFDKNYELRLWRREHQLKAALLLASNTENHSEMFAERMEKYPLIGARPGFDEFDFDCDKTESCFTELRGLKGERNIVPIKNNSGKKIPYLCLSKHYKWMYKPCTNNSFKNFQAGWSLYASRFTGISYIMEGL